MSDAAKIDAYLAALPGEKRVVMDDWRRRIRTLVPDAVEAFSYGMPAFKWQGKGLVAYAAAKAHFGYYPMSSRTIETLAEELRHLKTSRGAVQFTAVRPLTDRLLQRLLETRKAEISAGSG